MNAAPIAGRYKILDRLHDGRLKVVYRVEDLRSKGRLLVLKKPRDPHSAASAALVAEYRKLADLSHPNIVRVIDLEFDDDRSPLLLLESVVGRPLAQCAGVSRASLATIMLGCLRGLGYLHARGWAHSDVKPDNIIVAIDPERGVESVKLIDFDLAAAPGPETRRRGTMPFIAPEVLDERRPIDQRVDLFALGVSALSVMLEVEYPEPSTIRDFQRGTDGVFGPSVARFGREFSDFVRTLIADAADDRFPSARDAARALIATGVLPGATIESAESLSAMLFRPPFSGRAFEISAAIDAMPLQGRPRVPGGRVGHGFVLIAGAEGTGRSRFLENFAVAAKADQVRTKAYTAEAVNSSRASLSDLIASDFKAPEDSTPSLYFPSSAIAEYDGCDGGNFREFALAADGLIKCAKTRTICITIDDIDRLDDASRRFLSYAIHRISAALTQDPSPPTIQVVMTIRTDVLAEAYWKDLFREPRSEHLLLYQSIENFTGTAFADFSRAMLAPFSPSDLALAEIERRTGGNPRRVTEISAALAFFEGSDFDLEKRLTPDLIAVVDLSAAEERRAEESLRGVSADALVVLRCAVLSPIPITHRMVGEFAELSPDRVAFAAAMLEDRGILQKSARGDGLQPIEDVAAVFRKSLPSGDVRDAHDRLAEAARRCGLPLWVVTYHRLLGTDPRSVLGAYDEILSARRDAVAPHEFEKIASAALDALVELSPWLYDETVYALVRHYVRRGLHSNAEKTIDRAAENPHRPRREYYRAKIAVASGRVEDGLAAFERAAGLPDADMRTIVEALLECAHLHQKASRFKETAESLDRARRTLSRVFGFLSDPASVVSDGLRSPPKIDDVSPWDDLLAHFLRGLAAQMVREQRFSTAEYLGLWALKIDAKRRDFAGIGRDHHVVGNALLRAARYDQASVRFRIAIRLFTRVGDLVSAADSYNSLSIVEARRNRSDQAIDYLTRAKSIHRDIGNRVGEIQARSNIARHHIERGNLSAAEKILKELLPMIRRMRPRMSAAFAHARLGYVNEARGRLATALGYYRDALASDRREGLPARADEWDGNVAEVFARVGLHRRAAKIALRILRAKTTRKSSHLYGNMLLVLSSVHHAAGRLVWAERAATEALDCEAAMGTSFPDVLTRLARIALDRGDSAKARAAATRLLELEPSVAMDDTGARRLAILLECARRCREFGSVTELIDRIAAEAGTAARQKLPYRAFVLFAALAYHFDEQDDRERAFGNYTMALNCFESLVVAVADPRLLRPMMQAPEFAEFTRRSREFAERGKLEGGAQRGSMPDDVRHVFESIKQGFFDFERSAGSGFSHYRRHEEGIHRILEISRTLSSTTAIDELLVKVVDAVIDFSGAERGFLIQVSPRQGWHFAVARNMHREPIPQPDSQVSRKFIEDIIETQRPHSVDDLMGEDDYRLRESVICLELRAAMGAPLLHGDRLLGVVVVDHRQRARVFQEDDKRLLEIFATQVAYALENARLVREYVRDVKMKELAVMASGVAHDFNNILACIKGRAQVLTDKLQEHGAREHAVLIDRAAADGAEIVRQLQDWTRLSKPNNFEVIFLRKLVDDVVAFTRTKWEVECRRLGKTVRILNDVSPTAAVSGNLTDLRRVFTNLLLNAVAAMPEGGTIRFESAMTEDRVRISIQDTGIGMTETVRENMFEPFFTTKERKGSGLGMPIIYAIVTRHSGTIEVDSEIGRGTKITIEWPRSAAVSVIEEVPPNPAPSIKTGQCVLVVEDEEGVRSLLREILARAGYAVLEAGSAVEALDLVGTRHVDAILTDYGMVPMNGVEMAMRIKKDRPNLPIVLLTGWASEMSHQDPMMVNIDGVLGKPFENADVLTTLARFF